MSSKAMCIILGWNSIMRPDHVHVQNGVLIMRSFACRNSIMRPLRKMAGRPPQGEHVNMSDAGSEAPMESKVV